MRIEPLKQECHWTNLKRTHQDQATWVAFGNNRWDQCMPSCFQSLQATPWDLKTSPSGHLRAESRINSHHSTVDQLTDPDSPEPFMPNHLLTMKSRILLLPRLVGTRVPYMHGNLLWLVSCSPGFTKCLPITVKLQLCRIYVVNAKGNSYYLLYFALHMN